MRKASVSCEQMSVVGRNRPAEILFLEMHEMENMSMNRKAHGKKYFMVFMFSFVFFFFPRYWRRLRRAGRRANKKTVAKFYGAFVNSICFVPFQMFQ